MPVEIRVPTLGESVVEATIAQWLKAPGDAVKAGEAIVALETDKVNVEVEAEIAGIIGQITKQAGDTVGVGEVLGILSEGAGASAPPPAADKPAEAAATVPAREAASTPTAARIAADNNIDLSTVKGTLTGGRIGKDDVSGKIERPAAPVAPRPTPSPAPAPAMSASGRPEERIRMSRRRQTIAQRLVQAQQTAAMLTTFNEIDMTAVMDLRKRRKDGFKERFGVNLGFMSFFTKASIAALKQFPYVNGEIQGEGSGSPEIVLKQYYDIGIAVGLEEGLVVPVIRDADKLSFAGIEKAIVDLAGKARANTLSLSEIQGGTFTLTNGGVFGSLMSTPILNAPQVGILGMHTIQERPVVRNGEIVARPMMYVALSYDHRMIDGSTAVRFLVKIKEMLEDPESMLLEG
jgi:2-oxoglutarate dehydrogenase E2 component (dihydrolipoamide succinyltransferase)